MFERVLQLKRTRKFQVRLRQSASELSGAQFEGVNSVEATDKRWISDLRLPC